MNRHLIASTTLTALGLAAVGCSLHKSSGTPAAAVTSHSYNATASVGDFITIDVDQIAHTITYHNTSTTQHGRASFTIAADGSYAITPGTDVDDVTGAANADSMGLTTAYEVPGYAFILAAQTTGSTRAPAIITAVHSQDIATADLGGSFNYMQFRTNSGGVEIGDVTIDGTNIMPSSYSPGMSTDMFHVGSMPLGTLGQHGTYLSLPDHDGQGNYVGDDYIFRTSDGFFAVDTTNGSLVCLQKAASKIFSVSNVGTYHAMVFAKTNAITASGNVESPAAGTVSKYSIDIVNSGTSDAPVPSITVTDVTGGSSSTVVSSLAMAPLDDDVALHYDGTSSRTLSGGIGVSCPGAFVATSGHTQYFLIFLSDALLISSYTDRMDATTHVDSHGHTVSNGNGHYDYWYGVALRDHVGGG